MSLSFVVGRLGDLDGAVELLDRAEPMLRGAELARATQNRGMIHYWRGDFGSAAKTLEAACRALRRHDDRVAEARTRINLGAVLGQISDFRSAERHLLEAIGVLEGSGQVMLDAMAHHNLGYLAMLQRDLPKAIDEFELAESGFERARSVAHLPRVHADHAQVLADAGLFDDADSLVSRALEMLAKDGNEIEIAGALVTAAEVRLAKRDHAGARPSRRRGGWVVSQARS